MLKFLQLVLAMLCLSNLLHAFRISSKISMTTDNMSRQRFLQKGIAATSVVGLIPSIGGEPAFAKGSSPLSLEGTLAPSFKLPSNAGKDISLEDLTKTGKYTVLYFYPGDFTQGCTIEANAFEKDFDEYERLGAQIVGVSVDSVDKHLDFKKQYGLRFTLLSDQGAAVSELYGSVLSLPFLGKFSNRQTYIISPEGKVLKVFVDVESKVAKHSQEVLAELKKIVA